MLKVKSALNVSARLLRWAAFSIENWVWIAAIACILSPISPHINASVLTGYDCSYVGTRGLVETFDLECPIIAIVDTRKREIVAW